MRLNDFGIIIANSCQWLEKQYVYVEFDEWVIMPNHIHGIIGIVDSCRGGSRTAPTDFALTGKRKPIGRLIGAFKTVSTKRINKFRRTPEAKLWQRNYYEHIIRNGDELNRIREYIVNNPMKWQFDQENPNNDTQTEQPLFRQ